MFTEYFFYNCNHPEGNIVDGQLLVARPQGAAFLVPADYLLDPAPPPVGFSVEGLIPRLILPSRDHRADVVSPQPCSDARVAVTFVGGHTPGPAPAARTTGPTRSQQHHGQGLGLVLLSGGRPYRQHDTVAVAHQVYFGSEASLGTPQRMVLWFQHLQRQRAG